ncbi:YMGG-like glycine zipper-containing protein [Flavisolibacter nicotianae]|uniref:YMGG-like glycine zipper-containing protein n=1 Tax=Flavisolibacter nicotianae TaxID=2364882 RepID=UPI0013C4C10F|nr:YMGG-like glycine zipper-containing protein [Flavisolibacter nicotianae]
MKKALLILLLAMGTTMVSATFNEAAAQKKWSSRKKGAVIGGVVGAGTGAAVSHKKGKGAIIGGAVGAGAGYVIGRHRDKKKGRVRS